MAFASSSLPHRDFIVFNHSPSIPEGFYVRIQMPIAVGAIVTVRARDAAPQAAQLRHFLGSRDRFIKRVAAVGGQRVCGDGTRIFVDGVARRSVLRVSNWPSLRGWKGCRILRANEVLLLGDSVDSFDGRYWGPIDAHSIEGVWRPV